MDKFDVLVIGAGPGGYIAAARAGQLGMRTALIEKDKFLGGTCLNKGCVPTKHLLHSAEAFHNISQGISGLKVNELSLDLPSLQLEKKTVLSQLRKGISRLEKARKVKIFHGIGELIGEGRVLVRGQEEVTLDAENIILATGSRVSLPGFIPIHPRIISSDQALDFETLPERIMVMGAGAVGIEFACMLASWGAKVTLVEMMDQIAPGEEPRLARLL
jgi:dihydrolipoyl dehydrogenase